MFSYFLDNKGGYFFCVSFCFKSFIAGQTWDNRLMNEQGVVNKNVVAVSVVVCFNQLVSNGLFFIRWRELFGRRTYLLSMNLFKTTD